MSLSPPSRGNNTFPHFSSNCTRCLYFAPCRQKSKQRQWTSLQNCKLIEMSSSAYFKIVPKGREFIKPFSQSVRVCVCVQCSVLAVGHHVLNSQMASTRTSYLPDRTAPCRRRLQTLSCNFNQNGFLLSLTCSAHTHWPSVENSAVCNLQAEH